MKAPSIATTSFLVEDYVPERLDLKLAPATPSIRIGEEANINVDARYLYGAPGAGLAVSGEYTIQPTGNAGIPALEGYIVGLADEPFETIYNQLGSAGETDAEGKAVVAVELPDLTSTRPLEATFNLSVGETGGRAVTRQVKMPIAPSGVLIGVKRADESQAGASTANFEVVAVDPDGNRIALPGVTWEIARIETNYQWFSRDGRWDYETIRTERKAGNGTVDLTADGVARISAAIEDYAEYRITVKSAGETASETGFTFWNGWDGGGSATAPDRLDLTLDAKDYTAGSVMKVRVAPRFAGKATLAVIGDKLEPSPSSMCRKAARRLMCRSRPNGAPAPISSPWPIARSMSATSACPAVRSDLPGSTSIPRSGS